MSIFSRFFVSAVILFLAIPGVRAQDAPELSTAHRLLAEARSEALNTRKTNEKTDKLLDLGLWKEATAQLSAERPGHEKSLHEAKFLLLQSRFTEANLIIEEVLTHSHSNQTALLMKTQLLTQAWKLPEAELLALDLIKRNDKNTGAAEALGTIYLLEKDYAKARLIAKTLETNSPVQAEGYLLEVKILFASKLGEGAEPIIKKAISLAPLNADCRYFYGYTLWRNGQKAQLSAMQAQWNFALEINPLYYLIHWHLGNGYTAATYADYISINSPSILTALKSFDSFITEKKIPAAIALCSAIKTTYPDNPLGFIYAGSAWYLESEPFIQASDKSHALDSARENFNAALQIAPLSGPAHNGLAAVLNAQRLIFLSFSDSVKTALLKNTSYQPEFNTVFPAIKYYPGKLIAAMVWSELHAAQAYLPLLALGGKTFEIIPLHHTLAESLHDPFFNTGVTFDNRQWMDIRGVGSGAAGIEYLLAGAYHERNVLLHEFTHLFHHEVLTEPQQRRIRSLYYEAMKNNATLDYYAANNEDEYFAQAYESFFDTFKVHPLDYKSMNTRSELKFKDPKAYAFIDSLVKTSASGSAGSPALKDNYAQVYANIIQEESMKPAPDNAKIKEALVRGTAYNAVYLPLLLAKAGVALQQKDYTSAETILRSAESLRADYAPVYVGNASLNRALFEDGLLEQPQAFDLQNTWLLKALSVEKDPQMTAELTLNYLDFLVLNSKYALAINTATEYAAHAPVISTYLRDAKEEAISRGYALKSLMGYGESLTAFAAMALTRPGNAIILKLAEAFAANKNFVKAAEVLEVAAARSQNDTGPLLLAHLSVYEALAGNKSKAGKFFAALGKHADSSVWYARAMLGNGMTEQALLYLKKLTPPSEPQPRSFYYQSLGLVYQAMKNEKEAISCFKTAVENNSFDYVSASALISFYTRTGKAAELSQLKYKLNGQELKPGENAF